MLGSQYRRRWALGEAVRRNTSPGPTRDQIEAIVFAQLWESGPTRIGFSVLALDADQAVRLGRLRLTATGHQAAAWTLLESTPLSWAVETHAMVMKLESEEEADLRRVEFEQQVRR